MGNIRTHPANKFRNNETKQFMARQIQNAIRHLQGLVLRVNRVLQNPLVTPNHFRRTFNTRQNLIREIRTLHNEHNRLLARREIGN